MTKVPSLPHDQVIRALQRDGWVVVSQKGSHVRIQKHTPAETLKLTIPAHRPIKRSTHSSGWLTAKGDLYHSSIRKSQDSAAWLLFLRTGYAAASAHCDKRLSCGKSVLNCPLTVNGMVNV
jgi:predicted RNA binding protein YcfA (HicA-like mRNA interferase family)